MCGEHLALAETDVFISKLLQVPGLRIEDGPDIIRNETVEGYEVNNLIVAVDYKEKAVLNGLPFDNSLVKSIFLSHPGVRI